MIQSMRLSLPILMFAAIAASAPGSARSDDLPYTVRDGMVDKGTYNGYRRYGDACLRCHGPDASGGSYAPDLTASLKTLKEEDFKEIVINGRVNVGTAAENVMPSFGNVTDVALYIDDIYAYVKARSDGAIGRGRPERFDR